METPKIQQVIKNKTPKEHSIGNSISTTYSLLNTGYIPYSDVVGFPTYNESQRNYIKTKNGDTYANTDVLELRSDVNIIQEPPKYNYVSEAPTKNGLPNLFTIEPGWTSTRIHNTGPIKYVTENGEFTCKDYDFTRSNTSVGNTAMTFYYYFIDKIANEIIVKTFATYIVPNVGHKVVVSSLQPSYNCLWANTNDNNVYLIENGKATDQNLIYLGLRSMHGFSYRPLVRDFNIETIKHIWVSPSLSIREKEITSTFHSSMLGDIRNRSYDVLLVNVSPEYGYVPGDIAGVWGSYDEVNAVVSSYSPIVSDDYIGIYTNNLYGMDISTTSVSIVTFTMSNWNYIFRIW